MEGSPDTTINGRPALRLGDRGEHADCCGENAWRVVAGAPTVVVNGKPLARVGDDVAHCGGEGKLVQGSEDVEVGDAGASGPAAQAHAHAHVQGESA